jgi:histone acetyltransferase (RNA polymerase elongator complex component)
MPICVICNGGFCGQSRDSPAEPCHCGACVTRTDSWEITSARLAQLHKAWHAMKRGKPEPETDDDSD